MVRIASLVPSGTDIVRALGLGSALVGVTYCCDAPGVPVVVRPRRPKDGLTQAEIDALGAAEAAARASPFAVDEALLRDLRPDVVLTQDTCPVCALPGDEGRRVAGADARVVSLQPHTVEESFAAMHAVAEACRVAGRGRTLVEGLRARMAAVADRCGGLPAVPVACLEWMDPPWSAGHWVPELVARAGGREVLGNPGRPSERLEWAHVRAARPEATFLMPCSLGQQRTLADAERLDFHGLGAVWAAAAGQLFARGGPALADGLETLAAALHPEADLPPPRFPAVRVR